jgi:transcriptional regulator with XRE-family HTH domain
MAPANYDLWPDTLEANEMLTEWGGTPLSFWRDQRGLTQEELASTCGIGLRRIQLLEMDAEKAEPDENERLAKALRVSVIDIELGDEMLG